MKKLDSLILFYSKINRANIDQLKISAQTARDTLEALLDYRDMQDNTRKVSAVYSKRDHTYVCGACGRKIANRDRFCRGCGRENTWDYSMKEDKAYDT